MASIKELKIKIASLKSTEKITKAMKMIAATKLRKSQLAVNASKPYALGLRRLLNQTLPVVSSDSPLTKAKAIVKKVHLLVFTSDRGLCGGFNSNILKETNAFITKQRASGKEVVLSFAGKRAYDYFGKKIPMTTFYQEAVKLGSYGEAENICNDLQTSFETGQCDEVYFIYNYFKSAVLQFPQVEKLFPYSTYQGSELIESQMEQTEKTQYKHFIFEPNAQEIFDKVLSQTVRFSIYNSLLNSLASEHASRMTAMDNASKNAGELIDKYTLQMNRARQAAITTELTEIVSGAESLKG